MNIALLGCGGVGKAFIRLLQEKERQLMAQGLCISLKYVLSSKGGVYNPQGIDKADFLEFAAS